MCQLGSVGLGLELRLGSGLVIIIIIIIVFNIAKSQRSTNICHAGQPHTV